MSISPIEQRLEKMETDIRHIKTMLSELLDNTKAINQDQPEERILSAKDVAGFLKLDLNVVYAKCANKQIPHFKMGKLYKFKKSEILKWVQKQDDGCELFSVDEYVEKYLQKNLLKG